MPRRRKHVEAIPQYRAGRGLAISDRDARARFVEAIGLGSPINQAAAYAGWHQATAHRALTRGANVVQALEAHQDVEDPDDLLCADFYREVTLAKSKGTVRALGLVSRAAEGGYVVRRRTYRDSATGRIVTEEDLAPPDWKAASWFLSRTVPDFAQQAAQVEVSGPGGGPIEVGSVQDLAQRVMGAIALHRGGDGLDDDGRALPAGSGDVVEGEVLDA